MKRILTIFAVLLPGAANAADLPRRAAPLTPPPPPAFLFEGFYAGAQIGALGYVDRTREVTPANTVVFRKMAHGGSLTGGVHAGYDWRLGPLVLGLVGDVSGARAENSFADPFGVRVKNQVDAQGSLRGRAGFAFDRLLVYATGGLNLASVRHDYRTALGTQRKDWLVAAPTVGVGAEYALDDRWSARVEYRMSCLGSAKDHSVLFPNLAARHDAASGSITAGVSYRFGR